MKISRIILLLLVLPLGMVQAVFAQQAEMETRVSHIAGTTIYLDLGRDDGLAAGDTLFIYRASQYQGLLIVENLSSKILSARYGAENIFPLTRGEIVTVRFETPTEEQIIQAEEESNTDRTSILERGAHRIPTVAVQPNISGRVMAGTSILYSQTQWGRRIDRTTDRTFASPFTDLNLSAHNLPNGFSAEMALSYTYRYSSDTPISPSHAMRFYRLNIEKTFDSFPLTVSAGRFYNRYDLFSGFWDGVMLRLGDRDQGVGVTGGFEPIRGDEGFSSDLPKYSFFAYKDITFSHIRSSTELSFNTVMPSINLDNHLFAGLYQHFWIGRNRITVNLQADQNPVDNQWILSQTLVRGVLALTKQFELHAGFNRRLPYRMYLPGNPVGYERIQFTGGMGYRLQSGYVGGDVSFNDSEIEAPSHSISGYGRIQRTHFWNLGYSAAVHYWDDDAGHTLRIAPGIDRYFGDLYLRLGYQFYQSEFAITRNQTHGGELSLMAPFWSDWYLNAQARIDVGDLLLNNSLYLSIWRAF